MDKANLPDIPQSAHFIGIGGAGMSGIALVLHERGCKVTGSDLKMSHYVRELDDEGIKVVVGHDASTIDEVNPEVIVRSTAIPDTNPEIVRAKELGIEIWPRAKMLSALSKGRNTVAVAGTHGKTTTSSMCATMLDRMGLDPSFLIGGIVEGYATNGRDGKSEYFVAEADESDGSFLFLAPNVVVVTNIEADHLDHYGTLENIEKTFVKFMDSVGEEGTVIVCDDNPHVVDLAKSTGRKVYTYGFRDTSDFKCEALEAGHKLESKLSVTTPEGEVVNITIHSNPGRHNMLNATAATAVSYALGLDVSDAARALSTFEGAHRRFTHVADVDGVCVIDDYAHHPTEVKATCKAASDLDFDRLVVVFQPHRFSRTQALADQFATAFGDVDKLYVMDIFAASEASIPGVTGKTITDSIKAVRPDADVVFVPNRNDLIDILVDETKPGDLLITMGAGDVTGVGPRYVEAKQSK